MSRDPASRQLFLAAHNLNSQPMPPDSRLILASAPLTQISAAAEETAAGNHYCLRDPNCNQGPMLTVGDAAGHHNHHVLGVCSSSLAASPDSGFAHTATQDMIFPIASPPGLSTQKRAATLSRSIPAQNFASNSSVHFLADSNVTCSTTNLNDNQIEKGAWINPPTTVPFITTTLHNKCSFFIQVCFKLSHIQLLQSSLSNSISFLILFHVYSVVHAIFE